MFEFCDVNECVKILGKVMHFPLEILKMRGTVSKVFLKFVFLRNSEPKFQCIYYLI